MTAIDPDKIKNSFNKHIEAAINCKCPICQWSSNGSGVNRKRMGVNAKPIERRRTWNGKPIERRRT